MRLNNKVAVITGASQGIGEKLAIGMAAEGASVAVVDIADGEHVVKNINDKGGNAIYLSCDISDETSVQTMTNSVQKEYGVIDILVSNAAIFSGLEMRSFMDIPVDEWDRVMAVNVKGLWLTVRAIVPCMNEVGGSIINISTNRVFTGIPYMLQYDASKGAVSAMSRVMAVELGDRNIRVNSIAPGLTMTENVSQREGIQDRNQSIIAAKALKRTQSPEDLVGTAVFLASEDSTQITGQTIIVDGGSIMR